ncbi:hypothetical protein J4218_05680 [Candidatus Pacearchaeota archaeon]|nr:hypothetical protein [Candidatus Pacearchaeota archaeon]
MKNPIKIQEHPRLTFYNRNRIEVVLGNCPMDIRAIGRRIPKGTLVFPRLSILTRGVMKYALITPLYLDFEYFEIPIKKRVDETEHLGFVSHTISSDPPCWITYYKGRLPKENRDFSLPQISIKDNIGIKVSRDYYFQLNIPLEKLIDQFGNPLFDKAN